MRELKSDVESDLKEKGLPTSFAESLIHLEDNEKISDVVKEIKVDFDNAVQEQVKEVTRQSHQAIKVVVLAVVKQAESRFKNLLMKIEL